jgi:hypothetical protein
LDGLLHLIFLAATAQVAHLEAAVAVAALGLAMVFLALFMGLAVVVPLVAVQLVMA